MLLNIGSSNKRFLVNLDAHPDRTLGSRAMETTLIAHSDNAVELKFRPSVFKGQSLLSGAEWEIREQVIGTRWAHPILTFSKQMLLHLSETEIFLEHHPGPANGAIWVIIPSADIVFVGDAVVPDQPPFLAQADLPAWIDAMDILTTRFRNHIIISGRGGPVAIETVRSQKTYLKKVLKGLPSKLSRS